MAVLYFWSSNVSNMRYLLLPLLIFFALTASSQCKTFELASNGDTMNCVDMKGLKQGKWKASYPKLRGEPGYDEEGEYKNDRKDGKWRTYNLLGDLLAQENYKWGNKSAKCYYFTLAGLEHEESWRAVNPDKSYDTIDVQDIRDPNKYEKVIVKTDGISLKHGIWKYYVPGTGNVTETLEYFMDKLKNPDDELNAMFKDSKLLMPSKADSTATKKSVPKEVLEFEKKNHKKTKPKTGKTIPNHN